MSSSLLRRLLGADLDQVGQALRDFSDNPRQAEGFLSVWHHPGRIARFMIRVMKLPAEGQDQMTTVDVDQQPGREVWRRSIGETRFQTRQAVVGQLLEEASGPFRFRYEILVEEGVLRYRQARALFLGIPLPRFLSPMTDAEVRGDDAGWTVRVTVSCPRCGPIFGYSGRIEPA